MNIQFLKYNKTENLTIFFGGWASGPELFMPMMQEDANDCIFIWDYREINSRYKCENLAKKLTEASKEYATVRVMAWSLGVVAARQVLELSTIQPCNSIAINGTEHPADDNRGIPIKIFEATLNTLSEASLTKFRRRMCGKQLQSFVNNLPQRGVDELKDELTELLQLSKNLSQTDLPLFWKEAYISQNDLIFPPANQLNEWQGKVQSRLNDQAHWCPEIFHNLLNTSF